MIAVLERLRDWGGFFALLFLQRILVDLVSSGYKRVKALIDETLPDNLPIGAGAWLEEQIAARKLAVRVIVDPAAGDEGDAYYPAAKTVVVSREVWDKHDASFWAVAAHELGHALVYRKSPALRALFLGARVAARALSHSAVMLLVGNVLYGLPLIDRLAFTLLWWSLGAHVILLVDEASASIVAYRVLAKDPRLEARGRRLGVLRISTALLTYVAGFVGQIILVWRSDLIIARVEARDPFVAAAPLSGIWLAWVVGGSTILSAIALFEITQAFRRRRYASVTEAMEARRRVWWRDVVRGAVAIAIVAVVWNRPLGLVLPFACVGAIFASRAFIGVLGMIMSRLVAISVYVFYLPASVIWAFVRRIGGRRSNTPPPPAPLPAPGPPDTRFEEMLLEAYVDPPWHERVAGFLFPAIHFAFGVTLGILALGAR